MGHWSDDLVDDAARMLGGDVDRAELAAVVSKAAHEIEALAGRSFPPVSQRSERFEPNGLPFVDVPDAHLGSIAGDEVWLVPDPVNPGRGSVLQLVPLHMEAPNPASTADGIWIAGQIVAQAAQAGVLTGPHVLRWLGRAFPREQHEALFRRIMDPALRFHVPVLGVEIQGWWFQISRRLVWVTDETQDEGRLIEALIDPAANRGEAVPLAATEPILIAAPMSRQPVDWAFMARIWPTEVQIFTDRPWSKLARAIHGHGIPTLTCDLSSTPMETACQALLKAYWHGYIGGDEPALANALLLAYPKEVQRIQRGTRSPTPEAAATMLLEQLVAPGFDPARGAEATRRYVRRKASIVVMEHKKLEAPEQYPWTRVGISERRFYKLLPRFAHKVDGRYEYEQSDVVERMTAYLNQQDRERELRAAAIDVLRARGFGHEAARKWLQRHPPEEAMNAWPRGAAKGPYSNSVDMEIQR